MSFPEEHLVLLADNDRIHCSVISSFLSNVGIKTAIANDGFQAIEMFEQLNPSVVIADLKIPSLDIALLINSNRGNTSATPFIITALPSDIDSAVNAIQLGAFDYLLKPYQPEILYQKINQAISATRLVKENIVLSELVSLYDITSKLTSTHNLDELLDITFQYCLQVSRADEGTLQLIDKDNGELVIVRKKGTRFENLRSQLTNHAEWMASKWVLSHSRSLLIVDGKTVPSTNLNLITEEIFSGISVPLKISGEIIGVVNLNRGTGRELFTPIDLNVIEVLASQAGIAINNANLYSSINQKLDELMLVSTYSEQLMGIVDKYDVIRCLYETVIKNFPVDIIGFLIVQRRSHEFLYWSRGAIDEKDLKDICKQVIDNYNKASNTVVQERRVAIKKFPLQVDVVVGGDVKVPMLFNYTIPVCWEDFKFGAVFFGASRDLLNANEKKTLLSSLVSQTRIALTNSKLYSDMKENYIRTIKALAIAVDAKDTYTHGHSENVMNIAEELAHEMNIDEKMVGIIRDAGLLHDIGKIGIPGYILNKPGPLTYEEFNGIMKTHSALGANIVKDVPFLRDLTKLILYHHEHYNGAGYPEGLKGEQIPVGARILHVADAFEAMTSNRPYRNSLGQKEAIKRLGENSGQQFDPAVIDAFLRIAARKGWLD
jgi:putative nucleotidyltransferase with HDIG domain